MKVNSVIAISAVLAIAAGWHWRRTPGGLAAYLMVAIPTSALQKLVQPNRFPRSLDPLTIAFVRTLNWFLGASYVFKSLRAANALPTAAAVAHAKMIGAKLVPVTVPKTASRDAAVKGHWIVAKDTSFPLDPTDKVFVLYIHGGGYNINDSLSGADHHATLIQEFKKLSSDTGNRLELVVFAVDYPLSPESKYPAAISSSADAFRYLVEELHAKHIIVAGDSAGGNCAIQLLKLIKETKSLSSLPVQVSASVLISPWVDLTGSMSLKGPMSATNFDFLVPQLGMYWATNYSGNIPLKDPRISPVFYENSEIVSPPRGTLVVYGSVESISPGIEKFIKKISSTGARVEVHVGQDMSHDYPIYMLPLAGSAGRKAALEAIRATASFILSTVSS